MFVSSIIFYQKHLWRQAIGDTCDIQFKYRKIRALVVFKWRERRPKSSVLKVAGHPDQSRYKQTNIFLFFSQRV